MTSASKSSSSSSPRPLRFFDALGASASGSASPLTSALQTALNSLHLSGRPTVASTATMSSLRSRPGSLSNSALARARKSATCTSTSAESTSSSSSDSASLALRFGAAFFAGAAFFLGAAPRFAPGARVTRDAFLTPALSGFSRKSRSRPQTASLSTLPPSKDLDDRSTRSMSSMACTTGILSLPRRSA